MKVKKITEVDIEWFSVEKGEEAPDWINHSFHNLLSFGHVATWRDRGLEIDSVNKPPLLAPWGSIVVLEDEEAIGVYSVVEFFQTYHIFHTRTECKSNDFWQTWRGVF